MGLGPHYQGPLCACNRRPVQLGEKVAPTDIEEGMRVGVERQKYKIEIPLPPRIDPSVTMMTVEEKPDVTYVSYSRGEADSTLVHSLHCSNATSIPRVTPYRANPARIPYHSSATRNVTPQAGRSVDAFTAECS